MPGGPSVPARRPFWSGGGKLQITVKDHPPLDLSQAELIFIPSSLSDGRVAWEYPARFAVVYPAAGFPELAKRNGASLVIVNREPTALDRAADLVLHRSIGETMGAMVGVE